MDDDSGGCWVETKALVPSQCLVSIAYPVTMEQAAISGHHRPGTYCWSIAEVGDGGEGREAGWGGREGGEGGNMQCLSWGLEAVRTQERLWIVSGLFM